MGQDSRPLSPHLQIYRPQLTSVLSITHRGTGVFLCAGAVLLVYWLLALAAGPEAFAIAQGVIGSWFGRTLLLGWSLSLIYHLCNGVRHMFWDAGQGFEIETAYRSGWIVVIATVVLTLAAWIAAYAARGG